MTWALWKTGSPGIDFADLSAQHSDVLKRSQQSILILYGFPTSDLGSIEFRKCMEVFFFKAAANPKMEMKAKGKRLYTGTVLGPLTLILPLFLQL